MSRPEQEAFRLPPSAIRKTRAGTFRRIANCELRSWVAYDIPVMDTIPEGVASLGTPGVNSSRRTGYQPPCPPSGSHRYFFTVYALDARLGLEAGANKASLLDAVEGHVLAEATLLGRYSR